MNSTFDRLKTIIQKSAGHLFVIPDTADPNKGILRFLPVGLTYTEKSSGEKLFDVSEHRKLSEKETRFIYDIHQTTSILLTRLARGNLIYTTGSSSLYSVHLIHEMNNIHDKNALSFILIQGTTAVEYGYVPRIINEELLNLLNDNKLSIQTGRLANSFYNSSYQMRQFYIDFLYLIEKEKVDFSTQRFQNLLA